MVSLAVLGIDGSGKSTISRMTSLELSKESKVCRLSDDLELYENGEKQSVKPLMTERIRKIMSGYAKKAGSLKGYKIPKLAELLLRNHLFDEVEKWYSPDLVIMDGSPLLNISAWAAIYKGELLDEDRCEKVIKVLAGRCEEIDKGDSIYQEFSELKYLRGLKLNKLHIPSRVVFLDVDPKTACGRIASRGEERQVHETEEKLRLLSEAYLRVCDVVKKRFDVPVMIADGKESQQKILEEILQEGREGREG